MMYYRTALSLRVRILLVIPGLVAVQAFDIKPLKNPNHQQTSHLLMQDSSRRSFLISSSVTTCSFLLLEKEGASTAHAASFTPGGTLVDRELGVTVANSEASPSRAKDNTNVLFAQDYYFKFGTAAPWIDDSNVNEFPTQMPFVRVQQRYDALQKYGGRVKRGLQTFVDLKALINQNSDTTLSNIPGPESPEYALRAMGLLANNFCASENTGTTNELLLARWYVNEIYLAISDIRSASNKVVALKSYQSGIKAANSFLNMMNRVITLKVGDKFELLNVQ